MKDEMTQHLIHSFLGTAIHAGPLSVPAVNKMFCSGNRVLPFCLHLKEKSGQCQRMRGPKLDMDYSPVLYTSTVVLKHIIESDWCSEWPALSLHWIWSYSTTYRLPNTYTFLQFSDVNAHPQQMRYSLLFQSWFLESSTNLFLKKYSGKKSIYLCQMCPMHIHIL